jgi:hypothetical protein
MKAILSLAVVSVAVFWCAVGVRSHLEFRRTQALRSIRPMFALNGVVVRLDQHVQPALMRGNEKTRYLLLTSSDRCQFSRAAVSAWSEMLRRIQFAADDRVVLLSVSGKEIPNQLYSIASKRARTERAMVTDAIAFSQETGIGVTPVTAVLDSSFSIRLISSRITSVYLDEVYRFVIGYRVS